MMVDEQLLPRGISNQNVVEAFYKVPRHEFVPAESISNAYEDYPLQIGCNQTISQPYIVALMTQLLQLKGFERILEVGTGSGYQTAILAELGKEVYSVERYEQLAANAKTILSRLGYTNINIKVADGTEGWIEYSPFDAILVTAASPDIPAPLVQQLGVNARMVIPVGGRSLQTLTLIVNENGHTTTTNICECVFVPLIGSYGWHGRDIKKFN